MHPESDKPNEASLHVYAMSKCFFANQNLLRQVNIELLKEEHLPPNQTINLR